jgi:hypothetical protein
MKQPRRRASTPARSLSTRCGLWDSPYTIPEGTTGRRLGGFRAAVTVLSLALSSCATPAVKTETVEVKVPVAVQPITPAQVPAPPAPLGPRPSSLSAAADALFAQVCKLEAYILRADPLLRVSAGERPAELPKYPECER